MRRWVLSLVLLFAACPAPAAPHEARVPLHEGKVRMSELSAVLCDELHLPKMNLLGGREMSLAGLRGSLFVNALNAGLGDGFHVTVENDALVVHYDADKLPLNADATRKAVRAFTAVAAPEATAAQKAKWGLFLPNRIDADRPLVVLIHGVDCDRRQWTNMAPLLGKAGYQVAYFDYADDQPIADSAATLGETMAKLHKEYPALRVDVIGHSMGGLIARAYVEGEQYAGGVDRLILLGTPNHGSAWAAARPILEVQEQYQARKTDPKWSWTWGITDGMGEAGRDMKPGSKFLNALNARPRRQDVKYTIIAGNENPIYRVTAQWVEAPAHWVPRRAENWWGVRQCRDGLEQAADKLRNKEALSDGPVNLDSAKLDGVDDVVILHCDHSALYRTVGPDQPRAWDTIKDRLGQ